MEQSPSRLSLQDRKKLTITGVEEVKSFDESEVLLHTCLGMLTVRGEGMQLKALSLDGGQIQVDGSISELRYDDPHEEGGWFGRLFR